jgi:gamma-glutamyltranspeptidase/glutathione hydrolase/leukotriene-C4 hydrolase
MRNYLPIVQSALEGSYLGRRVYTTDAPTSGPVVLHILNILEHYDLIGQGRTPLNIHRLIEAIKCR